MPAQPFWKHPAHRIPTLALYKALLQSTFLLPQACVAQPGKPRRPIQGKGVGPPGSAAPIPHLNRTYLFAYIRDRFRFNRHCTSPRITAGYLKEAEDALHKLHRATIEDEEGLQIRSELTDMVQGRTGRLKEVIDHLHGLIDWDPKKTTQKERFLRLKRAQEAVWDTRPQSSIRKDKDICYRIPLNPSLFTFPPELDYYPPSKYPNQFKNQRGKFTNSGGVFLTEVTTSEGSRFPRIRGGTQPEWLSMLLKSRVKRSVKRVDEWKELEELKRMMIIEKQFQQRLGIQEGDYGRL
ncbi:hypothetical protein EMPS_00573 [Entomortierella parvispora]|uniref:Uncharacterized protein n=1 Tax=Entomortierella parvispora TaxID=205924 RepID=A0A9P3LRZ7_9FUNG|nr:hypothetical protein EMPS_00573 [Entomortierella parvispora]